MKYIIYKDGAEVNRIVADEEFCKMHYGQGGYSYAPLPETGLEQDPEPAIEEAVALMSDRVTSMAPAVEAAAIAFVTMAEAGQIDVVTAGGRAGLFSEWAADVSYSAGQIRRQGGALYRCLQGHTAQEGWEPERAPALWALAHDPAEEWPEWSQPICAADAYGQGAKVSYGGARWVSGVDGNVWAPGVYGWGQAEE